MNSITTNKFTFKQLNQENNQQKNINPYINKSSYNTYDKFENTSKEISDKSNNNKFDMSEAAKNFGKGIISPLKAVVDHPIATIGIVAGTAVATTLIPVLAPVLAVGFGVASVYQIGKGTYQAVKNYQNGDYDKAEQSFDKIGQGVVGTALSLIGIKQSAKIANEAKLMKELNVKSLTHTQKTEIATNVDKGGFINALKDNFSLFTSKKGLGAIFHQFKPSSIKTRFTEFVECFKGNRMVKEEQTITEKKIKKMTPEEFKKTPEGIRRASLSDEEIQKEVSALYDEAFDKLGIPKEQRPKLNIEKGKELQGGSYGKSKHTLTFNPESYKSGVFEMEDVLMHEATHCKEALLRAGIPQERVNEIVKQELLSRILNGESEEIIVKGTIVGPHMMKPPKMSAQMKKDFMQFASDNLYTDKINNDLEAYVIECTSLKTSTSPSEFVALKQKAQPLLDKLQTIIDRNPDFCTQYKNSEEALNTLAEYSLSHNVRYNIFSDVKINKGNFYSPDYLSVPELSGEKLAQAEQSLIDSIATIEGNGRIAGINNLFGSKQNFNQYQFSPEEVLAQKNGNNFLIEKLSAKLNQIKSEGQLNPQEEARIINAINKARAVIEYKTKGLEYYQQYTKMINNPNDKNLAKVVQTLAKELDALQSKITPEEYETITKVITKMKPDVATTMIPNSVIYLLVSKLNKDEKVA